MLCSRFMRHYRNSILKSSSVVINIIIIAMSLIITSIIIIKIIFSYTRGESTRKNNSHRIVSWLHLSSRFERKRFGTKETRSIENTPEKIRRHPSFPTTTYSYYNATCCSEVTISQLIRYYCYYYCHYYCIAAETASITTGRFFANHFQNNFFSCFPYHKTNY